MESWEKGNELDLEDIIKEFRIPQPEEDAPQTVLSERIPDPDPDEDVLVWDGKAAKAKSPVKQDTVRLDAIPREIKKQPNITEDTIAFGQVGKTAEDTVAFVPIDDEDEDEDVSIFIPPEKPKTAHPAAPGSGSTR